MTPSFGANTIQGLYKQVLKQPVWFLHSSNRPAVFTYYHSDLTNPVSLVRFKKLTQSYGIVLIQIRNNTAFISSTLTMVQAKHEIHKGKPLLLIQLRPVPPAPSGKTTHVVYISTLTSASHSVCDLLCFSTPVLVLALLLQTVRCEPTAPAFKDLLF